MPEQAIIDTSVLIALERINILKAKELRDKGFYISDQLLNNLSRYRK
jgi:hypothetical protein